VGEFPPSSTVRLEISRETLDTVLTDMRRIKLQLDKIASKAVPAAAPPPTDSLADK